jgi:hypothetical protein
MRKWTAEATTWNLAIIPLQLSAGLPDAARRLRRGLRNLHDWLARCRNRWRDVCCAGTVGGNGMALLLISHESVDRCEVLLHRQFSLIG